MATIPRRLERVEAACNCILGWEILRSVLRRRAVNFDFQKENRQSALIFGIRSLSMLSVVDLRRYGKFFVGFSPARNPVIRIWLPRPKHRQGSDPKN